MKAGALSFGGQRPRPRNDRPRIIGLGEKAPGVETFGPLPPRGDEHRNAGPRLCDHMGEIEPVMVSGHFDVGKNQPDMAALGQNIDRLVGSACLDDREPGVRKRERCIESDEWIVLDHQNGPACMCGLHVLLLSHPSAYAAGRERFSFPFNGARPDRFHGSSPVLCKCSINVLVVPSRCC